MKIKIITLDVEVYKDTAFMVWKEYNKDECHVIYLHEKDKIMEFLKNNEQNKSILYGFNIKRYDLPVIIGSIYCENMKEIGLLNELVLQDNKVRNKNSWWLTHKNAIYKIMDKLFIADIYLMNGWDNDARRASLKWVCCNLNRNNIVETPVNFDEEIIDKPEVLQKCIDYCINDVRETENLINHFKVMFKGRYEMFKKYKQKQMMSCDNTTVGYHIIKHFLEKENIPLGQKRHFKADHTIPVKSIVFPYIRIKNKFVNEQIENKYIYVKNEDYFKFTADLPNNVPLRPFIDKTVIHFGKGGGHGCYKKTIFESNEEYTILSFDVASYYPSIVIENKLYIHQIGKAFIDVYSNIKKERFKYPKGDPNNLYLKETLNAIVGLSNNMDSDFYDPYFFYSVTLNGQLILYWICEEIVHKTRSRVLLFNTDGCEIMIHRNDVTLFYEIMKDFEEKTKLVFEYKEYEKLIVANVNNYIALYKTGKKEDGRNDNPDTVNPKMVFFRNGEEYAVKTKGIIFNIQDNELHKNNGGRIYKKALLNYYIHQIPIAETIYNNNNIEDYLIFVRKNNNTAIVYYDGKNYNELKNRVIRYVYSKPGVTLSKLYRKGKNGYTALNKSNKVSERIVEYIDREDINVVNKVSYFNHLQNIINNMIETSNTLI